MNEWSERVRKIINGHNKRKNDIENIFKSLIDIKILNVPCDYRLIDGNTLVWDIKIGLKNFTLTNEEILKGQEIYYTSESGFEELSEDKKDLKETIKELIIKKIK
ncbi:hypothetical protein [Clostridium botulinum]|uniref:hypothetical protein n=1 Tax=Clostridium botulinum TaxID=1491 RepID=UPI0009475A11|nr:hypothetical protein [Clostridium botulinum]APQ95177.1 hypothetical protein RSJ3_1298 [Clostridium botulinum]MBN3362113.1 hypothetical protein [Clostridium botulinum]